MYLDIGIRNADTHSLSAYVYIVVLPYLLSSVSLLQVDYAATPADLQEHFKGCGQINRITIMVDKFTGHPKG